MIDATEFSDLVERCKDQAFSVAYAILHNADLAHDVVADALTLAWIHRTQFRGDGPLAAWFTRIVKNRALEWRRKQMCMPPTCQLDAELPLWQLDSGHNIERAMIARERNALVRSVVRRLPPMHRMPIRLVYWDGLNCEVAADRLEISRSAFKSRLGRSKRMFRVLWQEKDRTNEGN
jgi:RNA polymerase sigma-70 factor (ECF subfamily)